MRYLLSILTIFLLSVHTATAAFFTDEVRARIVAFWNAPSRYTITARADAAKTGPWVVRLTPEASQWLYNYGHINNAGKTPPTEISKPNAAQATDWDKWVASKLAYDQWEAKAVADAANVQTVSQPNAPTNTPNTPPTTVAKAPPAPPGLIPPSLLAAAGNPPPLAAAVAPLRYVITFEDGDSITYTDHVAVNPHYEYFRFAQGVIHPGTLLSQLPDAELNALFAESGMTPFEQHVAKAVSRLEGGFESVNTYDTGYLSVGFVQFATLQEGAGSLGDVLRQEKESRLVDFENDFRNYGIDVNPQSQVVVLDPATGAELTGAQAVLKIIDDKRLTAVFQHAGARSRAFRVAQVQIAKRNYYPADNTVKVTLNGQVLNGRIGDILKSEAGMATLFDRKVNTGNIRRLSTVLEQVMTAHHLTKIEEAASYEREIIQAMKWRRDFLRDKNLSQPAARG